MNSYSTTPSGLQTLFHSSQQVNHVIPELGMRDCLSEMAGMIQRDCLRWDEFDLAERRGLPTVLSLQAIRAQRELLDH